MMQLSSHSKAFASIVVCLVSQAVAHEVPVVASYSLAASFAAALLGLYFLRVHSRELMAVEEVCRECAAGNMERRVILPKARGGMQTMMYSVNRFIDVADAYIRESSASAEHAAQGKFYRTILSGGMQGTWGASAGKLNDSASQVRLRLIESVRGAGKRLEESVMHTITGLGSSMGKLMETSESLNGIAAKGSEEAQNLSVATGTISQNMSTIAAAVEEMTAAIKEISHQVNSASQLSRDAVSESDRATSVLKSLEVSSDRIGEVAKLINGIAEQVNLLALNATIEAMRAGEAGRGFSVVANEIKNLAGRTSQATEQVEQLIAQVRQDVAQTSGALRTITTKIGSVNESSCMIAAAVEQQSATTVEISRNLQETSRTVQGFAGAVESMAQSSGKTRAASEDMHGSSATLASASDKLKHEVQDFIKGLEKAA